MSIAQAAPAIMEMERGDTGLVSTETAVTLFGLGLGAVGAGAQLLAARNLARVGTGEVSPWALALPIGVAAVGLVGATFLLPGAKINLPV